MSHAKGCRASSGCQGCVRAGEDGAPLSPTNAKEVLLEVEAQREAEVLELRARVAKLESSR